MRSAFLILAYLADRCDCMQEDQANTPTVPLMFINTLMIVYLLVLG